MRLSRSSSVPDRFRFAKRVAIGISSTAPGLVRCALRAIWETTFRKELSVTLCDRPDLKGDHDDGVHHRDRGRRHELCRVRT